MKLKLTICALAVVMLSSMTGCYFSPPPLDGTARLTPPVPYYGQTLVFDEFSDKLKVCVNYTGDNPEIGSTAKALLSSSNNVAVATPEPSSPQAVKVPGYDILISFQSFYNVLNPAPNCVMNHKLTATVSSRAGSRLYAPWQHISESGDFTPTEIAAKQILAANAKKAVEQWLYNDFLSVADKYTGVSIIRYRTKRYFIEFWPFYFEEDIIKLNNEFKNMPGVLAVDLVESNPKYRLASFRIMYRKDMYPKGFHIKEK